MKEKLIIMDLDPYMHYRVFTLPLKAIDISSDRYYLMDNNEEKEEVIEEIDWDRFLEN